MCFNRQNAFTAAVLGVVAQGVPAIKSSTGMCVYRDSRGNKCAVGQLISDDDYNRNMEYMSLDGGADNELTRVLGVYTDSDVGFLRQLQKDTHDRAFLENRHNLAADFIPAFTKYASQFAELHDLEMPDVESIRQ